MVTSPSMTTSELIDYIKSAGAIPASQKTFQTADLLRLLNTEFMVGLIPSILSVHEEYFLYSQEVSIVNGQSTYDIPYRAIGGRLRDLFFKDSTSGRIYKLSKISIDDIPYFDNANSTGLGVNHYYIQGNQVVLTTTPSTGILLFKYFLRPGELVETTRVGVIASKAIDGSNTVLTLTSAPSVFTSSLQYDFIQDRPGHRTLKFDVSPVSVNTSANTITFLTSDLPTDLIVNDHVCIAGEAMVPQCPSELHPILAHRVVQRCMEAQGDQEGLAAASAKVGELEAKTFNLIDNRVEGAATKVTNFGSTLRQARRWSRRGFYR